MVSHWGSAKNKNFKKMHWWPTRFQGISTSSICCDSATYRAAPIPSIVTEKVQKVDENGGERVDSGARLPGFASGSTHLELCDAGQATYPLCLPGGSLEQ